MLVSAERVGVGVLRVELNGSREKLQSLFVLLLQRKAVSNSYPGLLRVHAFLQRLMGKVAELHVFFEVPKTARVILNAFQSVRLHFVGLFIVLGSLRVANHFHIGSSDGCQDPARIELILGKFLEFLDRFQTVVVAEHIITLAKPSE